MKRAFSAPLALLLAACMLLPATAMAADTEGQTTDSGEAVVGLSDGAEAELTELVSILPDPAQTSYSYEVAVGWETGYIFDEMNTPLFLGLAAGSRFDYREIPVEWSPALPESVDTSAPRTYSYTGTLCPPDGCRFADDLGSPQVTLTIEVKESIPPVQLSWPEDSAFYRSNGVSVAQAADEEELLSELPPWSIWLETSDGTQITPDISWDISGVQIGVPGDYTAKATLSLSDEQNLSKRYALPEGTQPFSLPVHIRDDNRLEIFLNTPGPVYSGSVYLPEDAQVSEGFIPSWYAYCGEDKPTAEQLDAIAFEQDEDALTGEGTPFFSAWVVPGSDTLSGLTIDFEEMPDETKQGWYAFYVQSGDLVSNYILIDSREPMFAPEYITGTRDGGKNSSFPMIGQTPPESDEGGEEEENTSPDDEPSTGSGSDSNSDNGDGSNDSPDSGGNNSNSSDSGDQGSESSGSGNNGGGDNPDSEGGNRPDSGGQGSENPSSGNNGGDDNPNPDGGSGNSSDPNGGNGNSPDSEGGSSSSDSGDKGSESPGSGNDSADNSPDPDGGSGNSSDADDSGNYYSNDSSTPVWQPESGAIFTTLPVQPVPVQPEPAAEQPAEPESKPFAERDTETGVTLSGVRIAALIEMGQPLVVTKGGVTVHISAEALAGLGLGDEDFLSVSITQPKENEICLMVEVGGVPVEPPPEMLLSLQNIPYDPAQSYTVTHESGEVIPCHEKGGRLAFTARMLGSYVVASESKLMAKTMSEQPTQEIHQAAAQPQEPSIFPWAAALVCIAVLLPALFLWRRRRGER